MPFADVCVVDVERCPNEWPTLFFQQETCSTQTAHIRDRHGKPIVLDHHRVCLVAKDSFHTPLLYINSAATIIDEQEGEVSVHLDKSETPTPGLFLGEFVVFDLGEPEPEDSSSSEESSEDIDAEDSSSSCDSSSDCPPEPPPVTEENLCDVIYRQPCYVEVSPNLSNPQYWSRSWGVLTISEIRLAIRDKCREDNFLLDNVEFTDTEIAWAITRPVECWNENPPPLRPLYTAATFPYRYYWLNGVVGELLRIAAGSYERNRLRYSAAGLSVDDKDKTKYYDAAADKYLAEYLDWVRRKKLSINVGNAFGRTEIAAYGNDGYYGQGGGGY